MVLSKVLSKEQAKARLARRLPVLVAGCCCAILLAGGWGNAGEAKAQQPGGLDVLRIRPNFYMIAGAGGNIGSDLAAKAAPDGYTLTMAVSSAFGINPTLYSKLPYDAINDFAPIANLGLTPQTLVVSPAESYKTVKEFVAAAKAKPNSINFASLGSGSRGAVRWALM